MPVSDLQEAIDRLEGATRRCDDARREANAEAKALRHARADAEQVAERIERLLTSIPDRLSDEIDRRLADYVEQNLERLGPKLEEHMDACVLRVQASFDELEVILLGLEDESEPLPILMAKFVEARRAKEAHRELGR